MPHRHYCTYFDHRYLATGLALYASLCRVGAEFTLWVLALDDETTNFLRTNALPHIHVVSLKALEDFDPELKAIESSRTRVEYYFTCSPCLPRYLIATQTLAMITYIDSDLFFFSNPESLFNEIDDSSVAIVPHRFTNTAAHTHAKFGRYNVGWLTFRANAHGLACLDWWRARCIEWCYDRVETDRYADQRYLDHFEALFENVHVLAHPGANLAPWNVAACTIKLMENTVRVDGHPLVFFHFQGFRRIGKSIYDTNLTSYGAYLTPALRDGVFLPYIAALQNAEILISQQLNLSNSGNLRRSRHQWYLRMSQAWRKLRARIAGNLINASSRRQR